jgi:hypothetical protein
MTLPVMGTAEVVVLKNKNKNEHENVHVIGLVQKTA